MNQLDPLLRFTLDQFQDAVVIVDGDGRIVYFNSAAENLTGTTQAEALGESCRLAFGNVNDSTSCVFEEFAGSDQNRLGSRALIKSRDGREIPVDICMARVPAEISESPLLMGMIRDVSVLESLAEQAAIDNRFGRILARSPSMQRVFALVETISDTEVSVLIQGESGTGKELVAREIHERSPRAAGPFHAVNCGALTLELLDSEIFGHEKGSFTGAIKEKLGRLELAQGGTLFLDEVGEMPQALQVKFLRVLQERQFERVGGTKTRTMDARILAATNVDLERAAREGRFRKDLYFRLNVVPIHLPPLRERPGDVELIAEHYLRAFASKSNRQARRFSGETMKILMDYPWPGNVRELINVVEYAVAVSPGELILPQDLPDQFRKPVRWALDEEFGDMQSGPVTRSDTPVGIDLPIPASVSPIAEQERKSILEALQAHRYRRAETAKALGMSRTTLWRKMRELGIA